MKKPTILLFSAALLGLSACTNPPSADSSSSMTPVQSEESFFFLVKTVSLKEGETKLVDFKASGKANFISSDPSVAEMNPSGLLIAKAAGQATITGKVGSKTDTLEVMVLEERSDAFHIALPAYCALSLEEGKNSFLLEPKFFAGEEEKPVSFTYESGNEEIATVDEKGKVTALKEGKAEIAVSAEGVTARVHIDVYTLYLKKASQWIDMLKKHNDRQSRYALGGDIDFSGVEYTGYPDSSATGYDEAFRAEINGFGYSVTNITFSNENMNQSLFGVMQGAIVRNVSFENMKFTQTNKMGRMAGLGYSLIDNDASIPEAERRPNRYENLYLDMTFPAVDSDKAGLFSNGYVYSASNIFLSMKNADGSDFNPKKCATVNSEQYFWWGNGTVSNSVFLSTNEIGTNRGEPTDLSGTLQTNKTDFVTNNMDAIVSAYSCLSHDVWDLRGTEAPTLKKTIH